MYHTNFIIPISLVDENFHRAHFNNAFETQKFWWRVNGITSHHKVENSEPCSKMNIQYENINITKEEDMKNNIKELYLYEILCGSSEYEYPGLLVLMYDYIHNVYKNEAEKIILYRHLKLIELRTKGMFILIEREIVD
jgi:hypothetical protein